jgi:3-deoxy-7-phosphoheptulonate synthase
MIIEMKKGVSEATIQKVVERVKEAGCEVQLNMGTEKVVIAVLGSNTGHIDPQIFEVLSGVRKVTRIMPPFKLASREFKPEDTIVKIENIKIGGRQIVIMAGPCAIETEKQILNCADRVKKEGGKLLRGGAFKPRTSPFSFQGLKEEGLKLLKEAKEKTGLLAVTEVMAPEEVDLVLKYDVDLLQIGSRNMQNYRLLEAAGKAKKPVLLKRGFANTVEEWLTAADYILREQEGSNNVILCERGIRTFDTSTRFTLDVGIIPVVKRLSHLPIVVDPSHPAGYWEYVPALAKAAIAAGADGLLVEVHPEPKRALSDGAQSLTFSDFSRLVLELRKIALAIDRTI